MNGNTALVVSVARDDFAPAAPAGAFEKIRARREAGERVILPTSDGGHGQPSLFARRKLPFTLGLLLGVASVAAALPGSPIRTLLGRLRESKPQLTTAPTPTSPQAVATPRMVSGVSVPMVPGSLSVALDADSSAIRIRVVLSDKNDLEVQTFGANSGALFKPGRNSVRVELSGGGEVLVTVPRAAERFTLSVRGAPVVTKRANDLLVHGPSVDTIGTELVFVSRP